MVGYVFRAAWEFLQQSVICGIHLLNRAPISRHDLFWDMTHVYPPVVWILQLPSAIRTSMQLTLR